MSTPGVTCNFLRYFLQGARRTRRDSTLDEGSGGHRLSVCVPRFAPSRLQRIQRIADASRGTNCAQFDTHRMFPERDRETRKKQDRVFHKGSVIVHSATKAHESNEKI